MQFPFCQRLGWCRFELRVAALLLPSLLVPPSWGAFSQELRNTPESELVVFTTQEDHRHMLMQLGIEELRPGPSGDRNAPNAANEDENRANPFSRLPELMKLNTGEDVTTPEQWWQQRRPEIVEAFEAEVYGRVPVHVPAVRWEVRETREGRVGEMPIVEKHLVGTVDNSACPEIEVEISMSLAFPKDLDHPVPVLMMFGPTPFDPLPAWMRRFANRPGPKPQDQVLQAGWGVARINPGTIQDDRGGFQAFGPGGDQPKEGMGLTRGIIGLTNRGQPRTPDQWGALRAWAWGASRGLDYLMTEPLVDGDRVGIEGVSRYGKAALVTMAFDQRFAMVLIGSSGKGGATLYRRSFGEAVETLASSGEYHWMAGNFLKYAAKSSKFGSMDARDLPVDTHQLLALCAPRLTFISYGIPEKGDAKWLDQRGSWMAAIAAQPAFRLHGAKALGRSDDFWTESMPAVNEGLLDGRLAWRQHDGGHTDSPNLEHFIRWAETQWAESD